MNKIKSITVLAITLFLAGCDRQLDQLRPHNVTFEERQFETPDGFTKAIWGIYALVAGRATPESSFNYNDIQFYLSEARGNTIKALDAQVNRHTDAFNYVNSAGRDFSHTYEYWRGSYNIVLHINKLLDNVQVDETDPTILQVKAEALFLRAYVYFNLVRLYSRPYYQDAAGSPGVMLITTGEIGPGFAPTRATVAETYQQVIADLQAAIPLFNQQKTSSYASRYAADALLSRVYLYMGGTYASPDRQANERAYDHADIVIREGGYRLLEADDYRSYYQTDNIGNDEDIFAINTRYGQGLISNLYAMPSQINYSGGLYRPSPDLLGMLDDDDLRNHFFTDNVTPGFPDDSKATVKYLINYVSLYSNSPGRYLRLAELYLNRAEAAVKLGNESGALADVNMIRRRAGLAELTGVTGAPLFEEILNQRKLELAFEGHASYDDFRNGRPMVRTYASGGSEAMTVAPTSTDVVIKLPEEEIAGNPNLRQND